MAKHHRRQMVVRCNCDRTGGGAYDAKSYTYAFQADNMSAGIKADAKARYIVDRNIVAADRASVRITTGILNR